MNNSNSLKYILTILVLFLIACNSSKQLSNQNLSLMYNTNATMLHPQYTVFHYSEDSSCFHFQIDADNLLFKKNDEGISESNIALHFDLFPSYQSSAILDSGTIYLNFVQDEYTNLYSGVINFKLSLYSQGVLKITSQDIFRNQSNIYSVSLQKKNPQSSQFYLLKDKNYQPVLSNVLTIGETYALQNNFNKAQNIKVRYYNRNFPLAPPPYHIGSLAVFNFRPDNVFDLNLDSNSNFTLNNPGIYLLQTDTLSKEGLPVLIFKDDFPTPSSAEQLIESLRYLTTREEYNKLNQSVEKKKAVDAYWLKVAGNTDRARKLIRDYYTRVQEANRLFTSYLEGWKTDRGMIYIIFGAPQTIYHDDKNEHWFYGSANNLSDIDFVFEHINNPFTNEDYNLVRSPVYETPWYMAVDEWRNGRIVNEY